MRPSARWRLDGDTLIVDKDAVLPDICLFTGEAVSGARIARKIAWLPPWLIAIAMTFILCGVGAGFLGLRTNPLVDPRAALEGSRRLADVIPSLRILGLIGCVLLAVARRTGAIDFSLSQSGRRWLGRARALRITGMLAALALFVVGLMGDFPSGLGMTLVLFAGSAIVGAVGSGGFPLQAFSIAKIDKEHIHLKLRPQVAETFARLRG